MKPRRIWPGVLVTIASAMMLAVCPAGWAQATVLGAQSLAPVAQRDRGLVIENDSQLPDSYPGARYQVILQAHGGVPPYHWRWAGAVVPGLSLEDDGTLHGKAVLNGDWRLTVSVTDSGQPPLTVQKAFVIRVLSGLVLNWKTVAHVNGNRIEGVVAVTNTTRDDINLTFDVKAIADNGRATEIGYQHFVLPRGTLEEELRFGETLPNGGYLVNVDAVGEVEARNLIYRQRMVTPRPLNVNVGP
ncbi:MAG TPA: hypothetical protein VKA07_03955 [Candidatus Sulfotelmatobacter sp.]|nr:hypothetical protein [Candidatus Sulfotelmatobacter sp.]